MVKNVTQTLRRTASFSGKEFIHVVRDPRTFFLVFISPAFMLVMLSYLFSWDVDRFVLGILDLDKSSLSRQYTSALTQDGSIELNHDVSSRQELDRLLLTDQVHGVLVVPPDLSNQLMRGERVLCRSFSTPPTYPSPFRC